MKRPIGIAVILLMCVINLMAQVKPMGQFSIPKGIAPGNYVAGRVLVKIRPQFKSLFQSGTLDQARSALGLESVKPLVPSAAAPKNSSGRAQALKPVIDITQYFEIRFDPAKPIEDFINTLYTSGYVDYAEPVYKEMMQFEVDDPLLSSQYYLTKIRATEAWNITQGSEAIVIAIIDSGGDLNHPDLAGQLYINDADPVNGLDDDNNGYTDDYRGWDFSGDDTLNIYDASFTGDNNPSIFTSGPGFTHGTAVGSCASAGTDDGVGMAGVGFKSKLLYTKHYADNQKADSRSYNSNLYQGILYAANLGARVINCSWGSSYRSQIYQDIITHVTLDLGCLVVAAAGNDNTSFPLYPASYDYVLSVASTTNTDKRSSFSTFGNTIDITAPGSGVLTAVFNDDYKTQDGTSFSSPIVAGAAALVLAHNPGFTGLQAGEQLRVTADESMYDQNPDFIRKLGKGRLDVLRALTIESPSLRAGVYSLVNSTGSAAKAGEKAYLSFDFTNNLKSSSAALEIKISTLTSGVNITRNKINPGVIPAGATVNNAQTPFELTVSAGFPVNAPVEILISYTDANYTDFQYLSFIPNPSYRNIDDNLILTTISATGRLGFENTASSTGGVGFIFNDQSLLFELGLIMGGSSATLLNTVRSGGGFDHDFVSTTPIDEIVPGERSYAEIFGAFSNSTVEANQNIIVSYRSLVWRESPYDKFVILEYKVKNPQSTAFTNFHFGIFADWDISFGGSGDAAEWDDETHMGYVFPKQSASLPHAGIQVLTGKSGYYAIDNDEHIVGNPFGIYETFTDPEKFLTISTSRLKAGETTSKGNDVSHVVSVGPYSIDPSEEITIAFALHAANNLTDLITSGRYADSLYNYTLAAPRPVVDTVDTCEGCPATLVATGASRFKWYTDFTGGEPIATGPEFSLATVFRDTTLYVSNAEKTFESVRTPAFVNVPSAVTGVETDPDSQVSVFPVPSNDGNITLRIDRLQATHANVELFNAQGGKVFEKNFGPIPQSFTTSLETPANSPGIYFLLVHIDHKLVMKKIMIRH